MFDLIFSTFGINCVNIYLWAKFCYFEAVREAFKKFVKTKTMLQVNYENILIFLKKNKIGLMFYKLYEPELF